MPTVREQARITAEGALDHFLRCGGDLTLPQTCADAASDVWEPITATHRLKEAGIDLERLTKVLDSKDNWGHLVHAYEVLTILGAVQLEMKAMEG